MRGTLCCEEPLLGGANRQRDVGAHVLCASMVRTPRLPPIAPSRAQICHKNTTADKLGTEVHAQGVGGGASRDPTLARRCSARQAATTTWTRGNSAVQPTLPFVLQWHAFTLIWLVQKQRNDLCQMANWLRQATVQNSCLRQSTKHMPSGTCSPCKNASATSKAVRPQAAHTYTSSRMDMCDTQTTYLALCGAIFADHCAF